MNLVIYSKDKIPREQVFMRKFNICKEHRFCLKTWILYDLTI